MIVSAQPKHLLRQARLMDNMGNEKRRHHVRGAGAICNWVKPRMNLVSMCIME